MNIKEKFLAILFLLLVLLPGLNHGVWRPDEPLVLGLCAQMARDGDFVVPLLNGQPFLEKPPLYCMLGAVAGKLGGLTNPLAYRSVSLLLALFTLLLSFDMAAKAGGRRQGLLAAGILATAGLFFRSARWIQIDIGLACAVTVCMWAYLTYLRVYKARYAALLGLGLGLAFMFKGLVGPAIVAAAILADLIRQRSLRPIASWKVLLALACLLLPVLPWVVALYQRGGYDFVREVIVVNNFGRFLGSPEGAALGHQKGPLFYLASFPRDFLPWTFVFIPALIASFRNFKDDIFLPWFVGPFVLLSLSSTKRGIYLLPLYPAAACMTAAYLERLRASGWERLMLKITWILTLIGLLLPFAAIVKGHSLLGLGLGMLALTLGAAVYFSRQLSAELKLVSLVIIAMGLSFTAYYRVMQPEEDYLPLSHEILASVGEQPLTFLLPDEIFDALLPMLSGRTYAVVNTLTINKPGLYLWTEKHTDISERLEGVKIEPVLERRLGSRNVRLAGIRPLAASSQQTED